MLRNLLLLVLVAILFWVVVDAVLRQQQSSGPAQTPAPLRPALPGAVIPAPGEREPNRVADISVHSVEELEILLTRAEQLLERPRSGAEGPLVSLVLHGPEVEFFALKNYQRYKPIVDHAAKLAALGAVDISICQTQMRAHGIGSQEVPSFLRQVPFGPDEVKRLLEEDYVTM